MSNVEVQNVELYVMFVRVVHESTQTHVQISVVKELSYSVKLLYKTELKHAEEYGTPRDIINYKLHKTNMRNQNEN